MHACRWGEAVGALEACLHSDTSRRSEQPLLQKLAEAQFLLKRSQRKDLYKLVGIEGVGSKASEREIRAAYKRYIHACTFTCADMHMYARPRSAR